MLLSVGPIEAKAELLSGAKRLRDHGIKMYATEGTAKMLADEGFDVTRVAWPMVNGAPGGGRRRGDGGGPDPGARGRSGDQHPQ
ncbi:MAG: hypothetical protein R3B46_03060 [Phycisphaerales bacterium]